jgi:polysaccharide biosynthesis/export protein
VAGASFSPNTIRVNVVGEVQRGGQVEVAPNSTLNQGILAAGGFNPRAQQDVVGLVRLNPDGTVTQREIPLTLPWALTMKTTPPCKTTTLFSSVSRGWLSFLTM